MRHQQLPVPSKQATRQLVAHTSRSDSSLLVTLNTDGRKTSSSSTPSQQTGGYNNGRTQENDLI